MVFDISQLEPFLQLLLATFLGSLIGLEREYKRKEAGLKTFSLVCLGSCFFTVIAVYLSSSQSPLSAFVQVDPIRVIQAVAIGISFIGSGVIIFHKFQIEGLTTAAALWSTAAVGIGIGVGLYFLAILVSLLTILVLAGFRLLEKKIIHTDKEYER